MIIVIIHGYRLDLHVFPHIKQVFVSINLMLDDYFHPMSFNHRQGSVKR